MGGWPRFDAALAVAGLCVASSLAASCASYAPSPDGWASPLAARAATEPAASPSDQGARGAAPRDGAGPGRDPGTAEIDPLPALGGAQPGAASLQAELVRRRGGEWVIASLTPQERALGDRESARPAGAGPFATDEHPGLRAALREYERAFEGRDAERLALVWIMNPYEKAQIRRLFDSSTAIAVSIEDRTLVVKGDRASLDFHQRIAISRRPGLAGILGRSSRRVLLAHDAHGNWGLDQILEQD